MEELALGLLKEAPLTVIAYCLLRFLTVSLSADLKAIRIDLATYHDRLDKTLLKLIPGKGEKSNVDP